jgi:hypothetical protein
MFYLEQQNPTGRHCNAWKVRKSYWFSMDWDVHEAATAYTMYSTNFCQPEQTLRESAGQWR